MRLGVLHQPDAAGRSRQVPQRSRLPVLRARCTNMKILFVASECVPFCKTGGLADVVGALAKELRAKRHDIRIVLPKYKSVRAQEFNIKETKELVHVPIGWGRTVTGDIRMTQTDNGV